MKSLIIFLLGMAAMPSFSAFVCPTSDDITHGINTQKSDIKKGNQIYLAGKYWIVEETQTFKHKRECRKDNFYEGLVCYAQDKKLFYVAIPFSEARCKYQIYLKEPRILYGEVTLKLDEQALKQRPAKAAKPVAAP